MTRVTIANSWVDAEGKEYGPGDTADVDPGIARDLLYRGRARPYSEPAEEQTTDPTTDTQTPADAAAEEDTTAEAKPRARRNKPAEPAGGKEQA